MKLRAPLIVLVSVTAVLFAGVAGGLGFAYSGLYDIAASRPHREPVRKLLTLVQARSVGYHARDIVAPRLDDPALVRRGLSLYREQCVVCHGAPGVPRDRIAVGLNPNPPPLVEAAGLWSDAELYWIVENGLKMAGMPAFGLGQDPGDLWAIVAWIRRMRWLSTREYARMVAASDGLAPASGVEWVIDDPGFQRMRAEGDPENGRRLIRARGCHACHVVPGVEAVGGMVGPPLTGWARRSYIAGILPNTPDDLTAWIMNPQAIDPGNAMPTLGLTEDQARDIAAYLYTLR